jgi:3-oxoacyl-[acyl-carrier protein] reductase
MEQALQKINLTGKRIVITGGGRGIGKVAALVFKRAGAKVLIAGRDEQKLKLAAKELECDYHIANIDEINSVKVLVEDVTNKYGGIDVLVNCAGVYGPIGKFHENDLSLWQDALKTNLIGTINMTYAVLPLMVKQRSGKIINLSGGGAVQPFENFSAYATSKAAVVRFTENLAKEYSDFNIQVNAVAPGAINTKFLDQVLEAGEAKVGSDFYKKSLEQQKNGGDDPTLAAELIVFLSDPQNKLTGRLVSAKWDSWKTWTEDTIAQINLKNDYTLRRIDNKYFYEK